MKIDKSKNTEEFVRDFIEYYFNIKTSYDFKCTLSINEKNKQWIQAAFGKNIFETKQRTVNAGFCEECKQDIFTIEYKDYIMRIPVDWDNENIDEIKIKEVFNGK